MAIMVAAELNIVLISQGHSLYSDFVQGHRILSTKLFNQEFFKNCLILSVLKRFSKDVNSLLKHILSVVYRLQKMVLTIKF